MPAALVEAPAQIDRLPDSDISRKLQTSLERKVGRGYNLLGEVDALIAGGVQVEDYVRENETTAMFEAALDNGGYLWIGHRPWDSEGRNFRAFGAPFPSMLQSGVDDIRHKVEHDEIYQYRFELKRREAELANEERLTREYDRDHQNGILQNRVIFTISPYPEEVSNETASSLGYKSNERMSKFRFEVFNSGVRTTAELSVAQGSNRIFQRLVDSLNGPATYEDSTSFLQNPIELEKSDDYLDTVIGFARQYDSLLEASDNNGSLYFCGHKIDEEGQKDYSGLVEKQKLLKEKGKEFVDAIFDIDVDLAISLKNGRPTSKILNSIKYWLNATDQVGENILHPDEPNILAEVTFTDFLTREAATILKKYELIRTWTMATCVLNEEKAKEMFTQPQITYIQTFINTHTDWREKADFMHRVDQIIAEQVPFFILCGGAIKSLGGKGVIVGLSSGMPASITMKELSDPDFCISCGACGKNIWTVVKQGESCPLCGEVRRC